MSEDNIGNEAPEANRIEMQCGFRTSTEPGAETICGADVGGQWARCQACQGVIYARCGEHGGAVEVARLVRDHEHACALVYGLCRRCFVEPVDRELGEELCSQCAP